jgi:flagellar biogenesis protein FliO
LKTLAPNRAVYVIRAGDKQLLLGVTQHQITTLAELVSGPAPTLVTPARPRLDFAAQLEQELGAQD